MNWIIDAGNLQFLERGLKLTHEGRVHVRCDEPLMHNRLCRWHVTGVDLQLKSSGR